MTARLLLIGLVAWPVMAGDPRVDIHGDPLPAGAVARVGTRREGGFEERVAAVPSPDGRSVAVVTGTKISHLYMFDRNGQVRWVDGPAAWGCWPVWSPDGRRLAVGDAGAIRELDAGSGNGRILLNLPEGYDRFSGPGYWPRDGRLVVVMDGTDGPALGVFDLAAGTHRIAKGVDAERLTDVSPDGTVALCVEDDRGMQLFDLANDRLLTDWFDSAPPDDRNPHPTPRFTPDGASLLSWELAPVVVPWHPRRTAAVLRDPRTGERQKTIRLGLDEKFQWACSPDGLWLAVGDGAGRLLLFDLATGTRLGEWAGHRDAITGVHFAGAGEVVTASADLTALLWELRPRQGPTKPAAEAIFGSDPADAYRAVWAIAADPSGPDLLRRYIQPAPPVPAERLKRLLADLGADRFATREAATKELQSLGRPTEAELRKARARTRSEEVRTRIDGLLAKLSPERTPAELLHARAVAAMEIAGTEAARKLLAEWAAGAPGARLTADAKAALGRLAGK